MMNIFNRTRIYATTDRAFFWLIVSLGLSTVTGLGLYGVLMHVTANTRMLQRNLHGEENALVTTETSVENAKAVLGNSQRISRLAKRMNKPLLQSAVVGYLFDVARESGVTVKDQQFDHQNTSEDGLSRLSQTLVISGSYRSVRSFVRAVEAGNLGITVVEKMELQQDSGNDLNARLRLTTYGAPPKHGV